MCEFFCEINRTSTRSRGFLVFAKFASLQSNAERRYQEWKANLRNIFSEFVCTRSRRLGRNFHVSKSQKKFWPADRNSELVKPNMYFAAALITFAVKTPTANEGRPTKSTKNSEARSLFHLHAIFPSLSRLFSQKPANLCVCVNVRMYRSFVYLCFSKGDANTRTRRAIRSFQLPGLINADPAWELLVRRYF